MFNDSYLRACMILWLVKKLDFAFLSLGGPSHGARVWRLGRVPKHRNQWQEVEDLLFSPQNLIFCTTPHACRGSVVVAEAEAACEPTEVLNSVVQGGHHLHLELEVLLWGQGWRHRYPGTLVVLPLLARTGAPGFHHLI